MEHALSSFTGHRGCSRSVAHAVNSKVLESMSKAFRLRNVFKPVTILKNEPQKQVETHCRSSKLLTENGIISSTGHGLHCLLPLGLRSIDKLTRVIDGELKNIGAQKLSLPTLTSAELWKETGRYETGGDELFTLDDRKQRKYVLGPTHEEAITSLVSSYGQIPGKSFPLMLYQITNKFRDEPRPRYGVIRGREFLMKDLYTFDKTLENSAKTYDRVCDAYDKIFMRLGVKYLKVMGATGNIGGSMSHEYHYSTNIGDDKLLICEKCDIGYNSELSSPDHCESCGANLQETRGIEVGHTFLLGSKYSKILKATFIAENGKEKPTEMGCFGIGVSRLMAASVEMLSTEGQIRWPSEIAPFSVCIIPPKAGSKEESASGLADDICNRLSESPKFEGDVLIDDRTQMTIGKRLIEAKRTGYPFIIIVGKSAVETTPKFELVNVVTETSELLTFEQLVTHLVA